VLAVLDGMLDFYLVPTRQRENALCTAPAVLDGTLDLLVSTLQRGNERKKSSINR
jgi:hypothetical protein